MSLNRDNEYEKVPDSIKRLEEDSVTKDGICPKCKRQVPYRGYLRKVMGKEVVVFNLVCPFCGHRHKGSAKDVLLA